MWSEIFFQNARDNLNQLFLGRTRYSLSDIEYTLYSELKSESYAKYLDSFIEMGEDSRYPRIEIE